jgi:hypothetical protein
MAIPARLNGRAIRAGNDWEFRSECDGRGPFRVFIREGSAALELLGGEAPASVDASSPATPAAAGTGGADTDEDGGAAAPFDVEDIGTMTRDQLLQMAHELGVSMDGRWSIHRIRSRLREATSPP